MKKILFIIILLLFGLFLYGRYIEINNFKVKEYTIYNEDIPQSFKSLKLIHFSDILYKNADNKLKEIVEKINKQNPDIVIFSGDLFQKEEKYTEKDYKSIIANLKNINATLFKFAVVGDNDEINIEKYKDILYESDFILLNNENKLVFYEDTTPINIIGLTNLDNIDSLLQTEIPYDYSLVITHKPDYIDKLSTYNIDTILSGHSLGGIIDLPFYGGLIKKDGAQKYINDNYKLNNTEIFISNGIGYEKYNFRLFNTPSINIYRFDN